MYISGRWRIRKRELHVVEGHRRRSRVDRRDIGTEDNSSGDEVGVRGGFAPVYGGGAEGVVGVWEFDHTPVACKLLGYAGGDVGCGKL